MIIPSIKCLWSGKSICTNVISIGFIVAVFFVAGVAGCARFERAPAPGFGGTFSGITNGGQAVSVSLAQEENTVIGQGKQGGRAFGLSAITGSHGPAVLMPEDGAPLAGTITLSPSGKQMILTGLGDSVTLTRGGTTLPVTKGVFAGRYATRGASNLWLDLKQSGDLLAGTGFVSGKPVAIVGRVVEVNEARGSILFSDRSQNGVRAFLSSDEQTLSLRGLGGTIEMRRQ